VDRIGALLEELQYSLKPALARGDFQGRTGDKPKRAQTRDAGQIQVLKRGVVRDVQEYRVPISPSFALFRAYFNVARCPLARARLRGPRSDSIR
jgi:hypothetical protein